MPIDEELNDEQHAAATFDGGHALVLAGAGTGKTRTLVARAAHLLRSGVEPRRILLLTFTRRAAREMSGRLAQRVGEPGATEADAARATRGVLAGTFHHFCLRAMPAMPRAFHVDGAVVIDRDDQRSLMKLVRGTVLPGGKRKKFPRANQLVELLSYARNTNRPLREYLAQHTELDDESMALVGRIYAGYRERKQRDRYLDYDDILHRFASVLREDAATRARLRQRFDHILVDEMQDTNPLQWLILDGLRDPARLFCVGDDAQSIYAFRGADFRNVHSFAERVPGATVLRLERNYRSTQEILDLAGWLLDRSSLDYTKRLRAHRGAGVRPRLRELDSSWDEGRWIADDLLHRHGQGAPWADHMILARTAYSVRETEAALIARDIPHRFIGGTSLLAAAHVKDLLCLVRAALSTHDELAWARYLTLWPRIGDATAARLITALRDCATVDDGLVALAADRRVRPPLVEGAGRVHAALTDPPGAVRTAVEVLEPLLKERLDRWDQRKRDLELLERLAGRHRSVEAFLETYALEPVYATSQRPDEDDDDRVTLITVHSAKGTEAPVCYVVRAEPGIYPHVRSLGDADAEEEERRILYVAMTRARDELILTRTLEHAGRTVMWGRPSAAHAPGGTAYLLEGVPPALIDGELDVPPSDDPWDDTIASWDD